MLWSSSPTRRKAVLPAPRPRTILRVEALEDRTVPSAATFAADLQAAQAFQSILSSAARVSNSAPVSAGIGQLAAQDFAYQQSLLQDIGEVQVQLAAIQSGQVPEATAMLGQNLTSALKPAYDFLNKTAGQAVQALSRDATLAFASGVGLNFNAPTVAPAAVPSGSQQTASAPTAQATTGAGTTTTTTTTQAAQPLVTLNLNPLDIKLLGLEVQTNQIQVKVSAQPGSGQLLGNLLNSAANLINLQGVNNALNNVLGSVVTLLNSASLNVSGVGADGPLSSATAATTPVLDLYVAPVHLNLLGATVDTTPIHLTLTAHSGPGLVLGNVVADLANLFNPPLPNKLDLNYINGKLTALLNQLNAQIPGISASPSTTGTPASGSDRVLALNLAPINLNLLGLTLKTSQIQVNADAQTGNGLLLGNVLTDLLNTLGATPQDLTTLNNNLNALLAKVIGVLNASSLTLPSNAVSTLTQVLQTLSLPNLINSTGTASAPILNLAIASTDNTTPPVDVNLLGLNVTTSNIQAQLLAQTGDGQILGNLLYNVANLLNPGGSLSLLTVLNQLAL